MKLARIQYNFADAHAYPEHWHTAGKRYLTFNCYVSASADDIDSVLAQVCRTLSPDDRFAVDLFEFANRSEGKPISISAYVFRHSSLDDHQFCLGSLDESEIDEIIELLNKDSFVVSYSATEVISTDTRGSPVKKRMFRNTK